MQDWHRTRIRDIRLEDEAWARQVPDASAGYWTVLHEEEDGDHRVVVVAPDGMAYALGAQREGALYAITVDQEGERVATLLMSADGEVDCRFVGDDGDLHALGDLEQAAWVPDCEFVLAMEGPQLRITDAREGIAIGRVSLEVMANALVLSASRGVLHEKARLFMNDEGPVFYDGRSSAYLTLSDDRRSIEEGMTQAQRTLRHVPDLPVEEPTEAALAQALSHLIARCEEFGLAIPTDVADVHSRHAYAAQASSPKPGF